MCSSNVKVIFSTPFIDFIKLVISYFLRVFFPLRCFLLTDTNVSFEMSKHNVFNFEEN